MSVAISTEINSLVNGPKRVLPILIFLFIVLILGTVLAPAAYLPDWWDQPLYNIVFLMFYLTIITIGIVGIASMTDIKK